MQLGEVAPGGVGAGLYGMLVLGAILTVFIAGLMVGRTPEYLGKKVEAFEMKMAMLVVVVLGASILGLTGLATAIPEGQAGPLNAGPHGFSEILYAYTSQTANNGSAFGGLTGNTPFYNVTGGLAMLAGRFAMIIPVLAIAGSMAAKRRVAPSLGTFPTTGAHVHVLLVGVVIIVGALTFFPALALGPIVEQLLQNAEKVFCREPDPSPPLGRPEPRHASLPAVRDARRDEARGRAPEAARDPRSRPAAGGHPAGVPQARPATPGPQPGHVRRRAHGRARDARLDRPT